MLQKIRHTENLHVLLWLVKDCCWMMEYKWLGTVMIFPTLAVAVYIAFKSKGDMLWFLPNLAVAFWISANVCWMLFDFYQWQSKPVALVLFILGLIIMLVYGVIYFKQKPLNE